MIFMRVVLCILAMLFTACGVCAALFPLMRKDTVNGAGIAVKSEVSLWYTESKYTQDSIHYLDRTYLRHHKCSSFRATSVAGAALNVAGCGLGAIVSLLAAAHVCANVKFHLCCALMMLHFVTFATFAASLATVVYTYRGESCVNDVINKVNAYKDDGYALVEGFILLCVATGGFFMMVFLEICS